MKLKSIIGLILIFVTVLLFYLTSLFYTTGDEPKVYFPLCPGEWEYLSHYLWRLSLSVKGAILSFIIYLFASSKYKWIKSVFFVYFILQIIMVFNYVLTRNQVDIKWFMFIFFGFWIYAIINAIRKY